MGSLEEPEGVLPMENVSEVQGKRKKTRPPEGGGAAVDPLPRSLPSV